MRRQNQHNNFSNYAWQSKTASWKELSSRAITRTCCAACINKYRNDSLKSHKINVVDGDLFANQM